MACVGEGSLGIRSQDKYVLKTVRVVEFCDFVAGYCLYNVFWNSVPGMKHKNLSPLDTSAEIFDNDKVEGTASIVNKQLYFCKSEASRVSSLSYCSHQNHR